jgi:hypothetical protein
MHYLLRVVSLGAALMAGSAFATDAGKALFVIGDVVINSAEGGELGLKKNARLAVGDTVITGNNGRAQLLLNDDTKIALRPDTRFQIEAFSYSAADSREMIAAADTEARFELLKGGFRSITGGVAKAHPAGFGIKTPVAVIGIRGTDFVARFCEGDDDCGKDVASGLYVGVNSGAIYAEMNGQEYDLYDDQFGFVDGSGFMPLPVLPPGILDSGLGTQPAKSGKGANRFVSFASDPAVSSTPVTHTTPSSSVSNAVEPAGHEDHGQSSSQSQ